MKEKLKKCPFCGEEVYISVDVDTHTAGDDDTVSGAIGCQICHYFMHKRFSPQQIIDFAIEHKVRIWRSTHYITTVTGQLVCKEIKRQLIKAWNRRAK